MKLQEYFNNDFIQRFIFFPSLSAAIHKSTTMRIRSTYSYNNKDTEDRYHWNHFQNDKNWLTANKNPPVK